LQKQYEAAEKLIREAAVLGSVDAMYNLGLLYENGCGVEQDFYTAFRYFKLSFEKVTPSSILIVTGMFKGKNETSCVSCQWNWS
jgi:TPR repeat protein